MLGRVHGRVEFDQHVARLDLLAVADMDGADDAGLERLDDLGAAARQIWPEAVTTMSTLPKLAQATAKQKAAMIVGGDAAADRRRRALGDFERRRQEGDFMRSCAAAAAFGNGTIFRLPNCMRTRLQSVEPRIAAAVPDQIVVRAFFDDAAVLEA